MRGMPMRILSRTMDWPGPAGKDGPSSPLLVLGPVKKEPPRSVENGYKDDKCQK